MQISVCFPWTIYDAQTQQLKLMKILRYEHGERVGTLYKFNISSLLVRSLLRQNSHNIQQTRIPINCGVVVHALSIWLYDCSVHT